MIEVIVEADAWSALPDAEALVEGAASAALNGLGDGEIAISLSDDAAVRDLNVRFRGKDSATNVLSFPATESDDRLGDIILAFETCAREAQEQGKSLADHVRHLTAHGVLHLLGYDHESEDEAQSMESLERAILAGLGVADPYA